MAAETSGDDPISKSDDLKQPDASPNPATSNKAKSCKGCRYYSSRMHANLRDPVCVGLSRSLPNSPGPYVGQSEVEASKEVRSRNIGPTDFRYACVGYSLFADRKGENVNDRGAQIVCSGLDVLVDRRVNTADSASAPATHVRNRDDSQGMPQRRSPRPTNTSGDEFLSRFARNANIVANGVVKNARRIRNQIKQSVDDMLYPYRRRPK